ARAGERQDVAGADEAAVGVRAAAADGPLVDDRDAPTGPLQIVGAGGADDAAADHHHPAGGAHERMPVRNGWRSSSSRSAPAATQAEPVIRGMTRSPAMRTDPSKTLPITLSCRQTWPSVSLPSATRQASLALVPVPHGERS